MVEITLHYTERGAKTWCAKIAGPDNKHGYGREWVNPVAYRSGKTTGTGTRIYVLDDGLYETHEPSQASGKRYWRVSGETITPATLHDVLQAVA